MEEAILQACINVLRDGHTNASQSLPGKYGIRVIDDVFRILTHARDTSATADKSLQAVIRAEVQHALRAFTPRDQKAVRAAAETFRANPKFDTAAVITELGVGEALVSTLDARSEEHT